MIDAGHHAPTTHTGQGGRPVAVATPPWFAVGLVSLGVALIANTLLGPLASGVLSYPFSETVRNETLGLEAVSAVLVAPLCIWAGVAALRGRAVSAVVALGPTGYAAYMLVQYVVGPGYPTYAPSVALHTAMFTLAAALHLRAWTLAPGLLPSTSRRTDRRWAFVLAALGAFVASRWVGAVAAMTESAPLPVAVAADPGMYWTIFLLDVGIVLPAAVAAIVGLRRGHAWARTALYALVGWFALVPPSVAAMAVVKHLADDPHARLADAWVLGVAAVVCAAVAVVLYRPVLRRAPAAATPALAGRQPRT